MSANLSLASLRYLAPVIEGLQIESPRVRLTRLSEGRYDIDDLLQKLRSVTTPTSQPESPSRFALYNLQITDGAVDMDDRPKGRVHRLRSLSAGLPFLSNVDEQAVAVTVEPRLAFTLDDARFDTGAQATPFARTRQGQLTIKISPTSIWRMSCPTCLPIWHGDRRRGGSRPTCTGSFPHPWGQHPRWHSRAALRSVACGLKNLAVPSWRAWGR